MKVKGSKQQCDQRMKFKGSKEQCVQILKNPKQILLWRCLEGNLLPGIIWKNLSKNVGYSYSVFQNPSALILRFNTKGEKNKIILWIAFGAKREILQCDVNPFTQK